MYVGEFIQLHTQEQQDHIFKTQRLAPITNKSHCKPFPDLPQHVADCVRGRMQTCVTTDQKKTFIERSKVHLRPGRSVAHTAQCSMATFVYCDKKAGILLSGGQSPRVEHEGYAGLQFWSD